MGEIVHGGRLDEAVARFGGKRSQWLDLSTGINPKSYPVPEFAPALWADLPDKLAVENAITAVRGAYGVDEAAGVSLGPGTQMHIQTLPFLYKPQDVAIVGYTYQEHTICWQRAGHTVFVTDGLESAEATARIVILVNPNNPDGQIVARDDLVELARRLASKGGVLIVDESFGDITPETSVCDEAGRDGLIVLRSLGKFYGLAGVRFGAAIGPVGLMRRLDDRLGPWCVSGPALHIATKALADSKWQKKTRTGLAKMRIELEGVLKASGLELVGGTSLFVLAKHDAAAKIWDHLASAKILTRSFQGRTNWLRFGMPKTKAELGRLGRALASFDAEA